MRTDFEAFPGSAARLSRALLSCALAAGACAAPPPSVDTARDSTASMSLPAIPLVTASLDGREVTLLLDTGSAGSSIDAGLAERLGLPVHHTWFPRSYAFIHGTQRTRRFTTAERLEVAGLDVGGLELPLVDLQAGGDLLEAVVLGCDVLRACRVLFEADAGEARFLAPRSPEEVQELLRSRYPDRGFAPLDLTWRGGCPYAEVAQGAGPPRRFLVDTGALQTFVSERTLHASDPGREPGDGLVEDLAVGPWRAWIAAQVADSERDDGLGFDVLSELTFLWDGPGSKLWIAAPRAGERDTLAAGWGVDQILRDRGLDPEALPDAR